MVRWWLDGGGVDLVVCGVGAEEADEDDAGVVVDLKAVAKLGHEE